MSVETLKAVLGVNEANCYSCTYLYHETGGEYGEIDCGMICSADDPRHHLKSFPFKKEQKCWLPEFWTSRFADKINGEDSNDDNVFKEFGDLIRKHLLLSEEEPNDQETQT